ncbi:MAG: hypothetical protein Q4G43_01260 [Mobilicoccus sp.]|nr:hypothetical protein [Mobilicoccus sp.]
MGSANAPAAGPRPWWEITRGGSGLLADHRASAALHDALRHLTLACRAERRPLPICPAVTVDRRHGVVEMHLAAPLGPPPDGIGGTASRWRLEPARMGPASPILEAYPALVPLGRAGGVHVLCDLGAAPGLIEVEGSSEEVAGFLHDIGQALGRAPWSREVEVVALPARDGDDAAPRADLTEALGPVPPALGGISGRVGSPPRGRHTVVLSGEPLTDAEVDLVLAAGRRRDCPTVLARAPGRREPGRGRWHWRLDEGRLAW